MIGTPYLIGSEIYLRAVEAADTERCAQWMNDREVTQYLLSGMKPMNLAREIDWISNLYKNDHDIPFAICLKEGERHIGNCGLHAISWVDRHAVMGILIGVKEEQGRGYGTEAMKLLLEYGFDTLNLHRLELTVYDFNERGLKTYRKLGFVEEGRMRERRWKNGRYADEIFMSVLRSEWRR